MATTYSEFRTTIQQSLEREDSTLVDNIDEFLRRAELRIQRELRQVGFTEYVTSDMVAGDGVIEKPYNWLETKSINFGNGTGNNTRNNLVNRSYEYCLEYWPDPTETGTPKYYADYGGSHWLITPTPDSAYPFEVSYYVKVDPLTSTNTTNWLTENAEDLYFYAVMWEAMLYLKNDARVAVWAQQYAVALESLMTLRRRRKIDQAQRVEG